MRQAQGIRRTGGSVLQWRSTTTTAGHSGYSVGGTGPVMRRNDREQYGSRFAGLCQKARDRAAEIGVIER